jgi:protein tyrosine/serine phosphatase
MSGVSIAETTSWIDLEGAVNARVVVPGVLLRSDNLQALTGADLRRLIDDHALRVVIDTRTDREAASEGPGPMTRAPEVRIEHRSLYPDSGGNTDLELDDAAQRWGSELGDDLHADEEPIIRAYLSYLRRRPDSFVGAARTIAASDGAVLVHCAAGKDRTGMIVAMTLAAAGVEQERIVDDYLASAQRIEAIMARLVSSETYRAELEGHDAQAHAPRVGTLERVFEIVHAQHDSAAHWLLAHGLTAGELAQLRTRISG